MLLGFFFFSTNNLMWKKNHVKNKFSVPYYIGKLLVVSLKH